MSIDDTFVIEILKKLQAGMTRLEQGQEDIKSRLTNLEVGQASILSLPRPLSLHPPTVR